MSNSNTGAAATMLCTKLDMLDIQLSAPNPRYQKNKKKIKISVDDNIMWSYKWTKTFAPPLGRELLLPLSSSIKISLFGKRHVRDHLLGSYSGRVIDFLLDKETSLTLQGEGSATVTIRLSPVVDFQQAMNDWVDTSLARLDNNKGLSEGPDNLDQAISAMQAVNHAVETCGQYIAPLGQALRLMSKLIDNVADAHPLLKLGWSLLSSVYTVSLVQTLEMQC
ncbi:hypothetical protein PAXRUDRAFT_836581 [Paxillus rubicundulus Ve08.2h10]|uniref:Uncharacterized protein n=1 Tax=Paxillus rubicundulus Ve08.2h10 TaxID=930991 RepID=A0A0D0CML8_9AGAM|nr:hypothetical protein PAXRUDRAFT_836581 [Paxillus rubicundulus Ve08.2h10]